MVRSATRFASGFPSSACATSLADTSARRTPSCTGCRRSPARGRGCRGSRPPGTAQCSGGQRAGRHGRSRMRVRGAGRGARRQAQLADDREADEPPAGAEDPAPERLGEHGSHEAAQHRTSPHHARPAGVRPTRGRRAAVRRTEPLSISRCVKSRG